MKGLVLFYLSAVFLVLNGCNTNTTSTEMPVEVSTKMRVTDIFKKDSVLSFLSANGELNSEISDSYIQKAKNAQKEIGNKAEFYYKKAITLWPIDKNYIGYGNYLNEKMKYDEAAEVYTLAVAINKDQSLDQYFTMIKNDLLSSNYYIQTDLLDNCFALNYNMQGLLDKILTDEELKNKLSRMKFSSLVNVMSNQEGWNITYQNPDTTGATVDDFIEEFELVKLPFVCSKKEIQYFSYDHSGMEGEEYDPSTDYTRFMEYNLFKSDAYGETDFQYLIKNENGKIIVIQAVDTSGAAVPRDLRCIYHRLVVYSIEGKVIDSKIIGTHTGESLITYKISPDLTIDREAFIRKWKKPFNRSNIDNEIVSIEPVSSIENYKINELGKIVVSEN